MAQVATGSTSSRAHRPRSESASGSRASASKRTSPRGATGLRVDCMNAVNAKDQARVVPVDWDSDAPHIYPVAIKIEAWDRQGLLRDIATVVAENRVNMSALEVHVYDDKTAVVSATVEIDSLAQLSRLMEKLEAVKDVHTVAREAR